MRRSNNNCSSSGTTRLHLVRKAIVSTELFEAQAERTPEAVAVETAGERISYRELDERANRLAAYLHSRGIRLEDRVGVSMERSTEMIVALLGVLKAGAAYLPLDPTYPQERLAFMVQDADVKCC